MKYKNLPKNLKDKLFFLIILSISCFILILMVSKLNEDYGKYNFLKYNENNIININNYKVDVIKEFEISKYEYYFGLSFLCVTIIILLETILKDFRLLKEEIKIK